MDHNQENQVTVTPSFMPVIPRLDRLGRLLHHLEEKHSLSRREISGKFRALTGDQDNDDLCGKRLSTALEEVQHKGTLIQRLTMLENRVLQLSLEMGDENTSKSSSATFHQVPSEMNGRDYHHLPFINRKDNEDNRVPHHVISLCTHNQEEAAYTNGDGTERNAESKNRGQKKKKGTGKWIRLLFRYRFTC